MLLKVWSVDQQNQRLLVGNAESQAPPDLRNQPAFNKHACSALRSQAFGYRKGRPCDRVGSGKTSEVTESTLTGRCSLYLLISKLIITPQSKKERHGDT